MANIKSRRHNILYYLKGSVKSLDEEDNTIYPVMDLVVVPLDGIKFYGSFFFRVSQVSPCASLLYYWVVIEMSTAMVVSLDGYSRSRFLLYSKKLGFEYHDGSVKRAAKELIDVELLIRMERARCKVNPEFCYRGKEQDRIEQIKRNLTSTNNLKEYEVRKNGDVVKKK